MGLRRTSLACVLGLSALPARAAPAASAGGWLRLELPYPDVSWVAPARDGTLYAAASDPSTGRSAAFRSPDSGGTWTLLAETLPGDTAATIAVDSRDPARVFATAVRGAETGRPATRLYASTNGGASWQFVGDFPAACGGEVVFDPTNTDRVYVGLGCSGGLLASGDGGMTFQRRDEPARIFRVGPDGELYTAVGSQVLRSLDGGENWRALGSFPCAFSVDSVNALAVDPRGRLIASVGCRRMIFTDNLGVVESVDGGHSWRKISELPLTDIVVDETEPSRLYAVSDLSGAVGTLESLDGWHHWRDLRLTLPVSRLALSPSGRILYAIVGGRLYRLPIPKTRVVAPR